MAKVLLMPGIASISGKVGKMIFRTRKNGQVYVSSAECRARKTPVSENEIKNREAFKQACESWRIMPEYLRNEWQSTWQSSPDKKKYKSLRGYVIATLMKYNKLEAEEKPNREQHNGSTMAAPNQQKSSGSDQKDTESMN